MNKKEQGLIMQQRHTKLHDTIPISLYDIVADESMEQIYRDGVDN